MKNNIFSPKGGEFSPKEDVLSPSIHPRQRRGILEASNRKLIYFIVFLFSTVIIFLPLLLKSGFEDWKNLGLLGIFLMNLFGSATVFLPAPAILSVGFGGNIYNPMLVAVASSAGSSLGESVGYLFGHSSVKILNIKKTNKIIYSLIDFTFKKYGDYAILFFSFIPNPFFDFIGIIVGLSSYPLRKFLLIVFVGRFLRDILIANFGARI